MKFSAFARQSFSEVGSFSKILQFFLLFAICFLIFNIQPTFAQTNGVGNDNNANPYMSPNTNPDVPKNMHTFTQNAMIEVMSAVVCQLSGIDPVNPNQKCLGADPQTGKIGFVESGGGAIGIMGNMIAMTFDIPVHTSDYFGYLAQNFGISRPAYAAVGPGSGFTGILPLLKVWEAFRNIVYIVFILVFIIVGLLIMLRIKIDPRTVMTLENQIPKIIIAIILVTFSFAIAGFLIDLMWLATYLVINTIAGINLGGAAQQELTKALGNFQNFQNLNALDVANKIPANGLGGTNGIVGIATNVSGGVGDMIAGLFNGPTGSIIGGIAVGIASFMLQQFTFVGGISEAIKGALGGFPIVGGIAKGLISIGVTATLEVAFGSKILGFVGSIIAFLIISIALFWAMLRLWFELIKAYIFILLDVVLAPFLILAGIFPGGSMFFGWWTRDMVSNLSVFPVTITMFLLGSVFMIAFGSTQTSEQFVPPLIGKPGATNAIGSIIGLGVILMTPLVVQMMKDALKAPSFKYTAGIGQALGVAPGMVGGAANAIFSPYGSLATMNRARDTFSLLRQRKFGEAARAAAGTTPPKPQEPTSRT